MNLEEYITTFRSHTRKTLRESVGKIATTEEGSGKVFYLNRWIERDSLEDEIKKRKTQQKHLIFDICVFYVLISVILFAFIKFGYRLLLKILL